MTTYFHADTAALNEQADRYVIGTARALNFSNNYCSQNAEIWSDTGRLLASTHQIVYYRE
jgi:acyl-CoA thioesterase